MALFFFRFEGRPTPAAPQSADIARADIDVWVTSASIEAAEARAREYLMGYAWLVDTMPLARDWPPERIDELDTEGQSVARRAIREGIAALFVATPKIEGRDDDPVQIRSLGDPLDHGGKQ